MLTSNLLGSSLEELVEDRMIEIKSLPQEWEYRCEMAKHDARALTDEARPPRRPIASVRVTFFNVSSKDLCEACLVEFRTVCNDHRCAPIKG